MSAADMAPSMAQNLAPNMTEAWEDPTRLVRRLKDYVDVSKRLIFQRQAIFLAATVLGAVYFDTLVAVSCYSAVLFSEVMDLVLNRQITNWSDHSEKKARFYLAWVMFNTLFSAAAISLFVIATAWQETGGGHFTPLFFLFAASLFAAMNNHQLMPALTLRLVIYGASFAYIALMDILPAPPPLTARPWLQFFTTVFVLYFILDCSFVFLRLYRKGLKQLDDLRAEHELAVQAYEVKSKFLSTVSHELRTPLTSIKASVDLINSGMVGKLPDNMVPILSIAGKNSKRLADLINDLLDVQKIEAGEMMYRFASVNLRVLVQEAIEANKGFADQLGIGMDALFPETDAFVHGDEARLMQVMANLLSNALKFSRPGTRVEILVQRIGTKVQIRVRDHGMGIPPGSRHLVFGKFTQIDSSDQRRVGGTGLGMHITKQIVEKHNGQIDFVSEIGQGSTFIIEFDEKKSPGYNGLAAPLAAVRSPGRMRPQADIGSDTQDAVGRSRQGAAAR
jgi:signal transduction histidine kinase